MTTIDTTATVAATTIVRTRPIINVTTWIAQAVLSAFFAFVALSKVTMSPEVAASGAPKWFLYFVGGCELAGAIGLLIPRLSGAAAIGLTALMIGATVFNLLTVPPVAIMTVALAVVFALIARVRAPQTRALVRLLRRR